MSRMHHMSRYLLLVLALGVECQLAVAHTVEAERFVSAQGVEMIQGRHSNAVGVEEKPTPAANAKGATSGTASSSRSTTKGSAVELGFNVQPKDQLDKDRDRMAILQQELRSELSMFQSKTRVMLTPSLKAKLGDEDLLRIRAEIADHEQNVRSLNAEIGRVQVAR